MTKRTASLIIGFWVLAVATSAFAECAWVLWGQETAFTERWWIPAGWPFHWATTERTPTTRAEFRTLDDCQAGATKAYFRDLDTAKEMQKLPPVAGILVVPSLWSYACVPFAQRPSIIEPGLVWCGDDPAAPRHRGPAWAKGEVK